MADLVGAPRGAIAQLSQGDSDGGPAWGLSPSRAQILSLWMANPMGPPPGAATAQLSKGCSNGDTVGCGNNQRGHQAKGLWGRL